MMRVLLDGRQAEVAAGATLGTLLPAWDGKTVVAVIRPAAKQAARTGHIRLATSAGEVMIETTPLFASLFGDEIAALQDGELHLWWSDRYVAAFGPFPSAIVPDRTPHRYARGDVVLGCAGYDPSRSVLLFSRSDHRADFGAAKDGGIVARVVSGRGVIDRWTQGDAVTASERVLSWADRSTSFTTADPATPLEGGTEIVTRVEIAAEGYGEGAVDTRTARSVEHLLLAVEKGSFAVGRAASTFIRDESMIPMEVPAELKRPRQEGAVTVRTTGGSVGGIYIYREEIPAHPAHTLVGQV
ncbi:MAG: hypothetical protein PWP08_1814, partial [Methanofollis sp.]|nr:hypothetical protein [Methanofollis sp.]